MSSNEFWKKIPLDQMSREQWESLCDGCARCCLHKLQDDETEEIHYTRVVCRYLDNCGQCTEYQMRNELVPDCVWLTPDDAADFHWLPDTCAYRLVSEGKDLPEWHPLRTGNRDTVIESGYSVLSQTLIRDDQLDEEDWQDEIIEWVQYD